MKDPKSPQLQPDPTAHPSLSAVGCKVLYKNKRVLIKVDRAEDTTLAKRHCVVRHGDQRPNLTERKRLQKLIKREYGFKIVSTEKRRIKAR